MPVTAGKGEGAMEQSQYLPVKQPMEVKHASLVVRNGFVKVPFPLLMIGRTGGQTERGHLSGLSAFETSRIILRFVTSR